MAASRTACYFGLVLGLGPKNLVLFTSLLCPATFVRRMEVARKLHGSCTVVDSRSRRRSCDRRFNVSSAARIKLRPVGCWPGRRKPTAEQFCQVDDQRRRPGQIHSDVSQRTYFVLRPRTRTNCKLFAFCHTDIIISYHIIYSLKLPSTGAQQRLIYKMLLE